MTASTRRARRLFIGGLAAALASAPAWSQTASAAAPAISPAQSLVSTAIGLAVVIGLILAAAWVMRRLGGQTGFARGSLQVVAAASVGQRERVVLVRHADSLLVLGVAPGQVSLLKEMPAPSDAPAASVGTPSFLDRLRDAARGPRS